MACRLFSCGMHVGSSSLTRDQPGSPALGVWSPIHWTTREVPKFLAFMKPNLFFPLVACVFGIISKKPLPNPRSWRFILIFSSKSFVVLALIFRSLIHFELIFVYGVRSGTTFILLHMDI